MSTPEARTPDAGHNPATPVVRVRHRPGTEPILTLDPGWRDRIPADELPRLVEEAFAQAYADPRTPALDVGDDWAGQLEDLISEPPRRGLPPGRFGSDISGWLRLELSPGLRVCGVDADPDWLNRRDPMAILTAFSEAYQQAAEAPWKEVW